MTQPDDAGPDRAGPLPPRRSGLPRWLAEEFSGLHLPAALATVVSMAVLVTARHHGAPSDFRAHFGRLLAGHPLQDLFAYLYWFGVSGGLYLVVPLLAVALTPGIRVRETGLGLGDRRTGFWAVAILLAVFLPVVALVSSHPAFSGHYPLCRAARGSWTAFLVYEAGYAFYFVGWEYLFRGYLLFSLEKAMGKLAAFATMMPFVIVHYGKPEAETFGSIAAGVVLGLLALRTRSFWYGAIVHVVVAWSLDLLVTWRALPR